MGDPKDYSDEDDVNKQVDGAVKSKTPPTTPVPPAPPPKNPSDGTGPDGEQG